MKETRTFAAPVEVRAEGNETATIAGYGAVFGVEYGLPGFTESVAPSAFRKSLKERSDLAVVWSHDPGRVLGTKASGTARFAIDDHGLRYEADLDLLDPDGLSAYRKIVSGRVAESSFSFEVVKDKWEQREDAPPHRTILECRLYECSPVLWGANPATEVDVKRAARSLAETMALDAEPETIDEVMGLASQRDAATEEPMTEPHPHSDVTPQPEPKRVPAFIPGLL